MTAIDRWLFRLACGIGGRVSSNYPERAATRCLRGHQVRDLGALDQPERQQLLPTLSGFVFVILGQQG